MVGTTGFEPATSSVSIPMYRLFSVTYGTVVFLQTPSGTQRSTYCSHSVPTVINVGNLTAARTSWPPTHIPLLAHEVTSTDYASADCEIDFPGTTTPIPTCIHLENTQQPALPQPWPPRWVLESKTKCSYCFVYCCSNSAFS